MLVKGLVMLHQFVAVANCRDFPDNFGRLSALWKWSVATFSDAVACRLSPLEGPNSGWQTGYDKLFVYMYNQLCIK